MTTHPPPTDLDGVLRTAAARWPDRTAVVAPTAMLTYAELDAAVDAAATGLLGAGAEPGDVIAVAMDHGLALYLLPFACARAGVTALLLGTGHGTPIWTGHLAICRPRLLIADAPHTARLAQAAGGVPVLDPALALPLEGPRGPLPPPAEPDTAIALLGTSGTTGVPKITMVTGRGLCAAASGYARLLDLTAQPAERTLVVLPLHYIGPLSAQTTTMPLVGGCAVLPADVRPPAAAAAMRTHDITHLDAVPAWLGQFARLNDVPTLPAWRTLIYGGAPMPAETAALLAARHPQVALWDVWGLSETHGPATAVRYDPADPPAPGVVGQPLPGVTVVAVAGELRVRGDNVSPGYFRDPETTAAVFADGWLATGDAGTVHPDGSVQVLDRLKDVILRGGANVFSVQVEQVLSAAPAVAEAAVFGVTDALGGEVVAAAVVLAPGAVLDVAGLRRLVAEEVGVHAVPRRVVALDALPRNATGKVDKRQLRQQLPHASASIRKDLS